jgi:hypothetical protein
MKSGDNSAVLQATKLFADVFGVVRAPLGHFEVFDYCQ